MYIDELRGFADKGKEYDLYSLKAELNRLSSSSKIFDDFERASMTIGKEALGQIRDLSLLLKIKNLASQIKAKKGINDRLHSLHFNLNILKNAEDFKSIKSAISAFLNNQESGIDSIISELNDFKARLGEIKKCHSMLLPKSLDNRLGIEEKYGRHIEKLHSVHKRQKDAFISTIGLFLKFARRHAKSLKKFK